MGSARSPRSRRRYPHQLYGADVRLLHAQIPDHGEIALTAHGGSHVQLSLGLPGHVHGGVLHVAPDVPPAADTPPWEEPERGPAPEPGAGQPASGAPAPEKDDDPLKGPQERPEVTKVILTGDRLRKYFPDVSMTPREIEESVYSALEERRQRQLKEQQKATIFKRSGPTR